MEKRTVVGGGIAVAAILVPLSWGATGPEVNELDATCLDGAFVACTTMFAAECWPIPGTKVVVRDACDVRDPGCGSKWPG